MGYNKQATDFLQSTNTEMKVEFIENNIHFDDDKDTRDIYKVTFKRGNRSFSVRFGQSIVNSTKYVDKANTGREYTANGGALKGGYKVVNPTYLKEYCRKVKGTPPTAYDVLACLQKYGVGTFEDFCSEFGYDTDSRNVKKTYKAVVKEYNNVCKLWSDEEIEQLQEIQ